jgi:DNA (cytosine-5)-methyltransferase 1
MALNYPIPVIDLFAGPGGLSEGFASVRLPDRRPAFDIALSIEKDRFAHATLELRTFFRHLNAAGDTADYYRYLWGPDYEGGIDRETLFLRHPAIATVARSNAWHQELAPRNRPEISAITVAALCKGYGCSGL